MCLWKYLLQSKFVIFKNSAYEKLYFFHFSFGFSKVNRNWLTERETGAG